MDYNSLFVQSVPCFQRPTSWISLAGIVRQCREHTIAAIVLLWEYNGYVMGVE